MAFLELHSSQDFEAVIISAFLWEANAISFNNMNKPNCINWFRWSSYNYNRISCNKCITYIIFIFIITIITNLVGWQNIGMKTCRTECLGCKLVFFEYGTRYHIQPGKHYKTSEFGLNIMTWSRACNSLECCIYISSSLIFQLNSWKLANVIFWVIFHQIFSSGIHELPEQM